MKEPELSPQVETVSILDAPFAVRKTSLEADMDTLQKKYGIVIYADYRAEENINRKTGEVSIEIKPLLALKDTVAKDGA